MADGTSKNVGGVDTPATRAEIDALTEVIAATIVMAMRARSEAATILLERALAALNDRVATAVRREDDARLESFRPS